MDDVRALKICYELLNRMDERTRDASMTWLASRLNADREAARASLRGMATPDKTIVRRSVGEAALGLIALLQATGAKTAKRPIEIRGPVNADITVCVRAVN